MKSGAGFIISGGENSHDPEVESTVMTHPRFMKSPLQACLTKNGGAGARGHSPSDGHKGEHPGAGQLGRA
jgi:hypothetical protein